MENQIITKIKAELKAFEEKKKAFVVELRKEFPSMFIELFAQAPKLKSISWTQYTPYFSDGADCVFSANIDDLYINGVNEDYHTDKESEISVNPSVSIILKTKEDVLINKDLAKKTGYSWYAKAGIGDYGLAPNPKYDADADKISSEISEILFSIPNDLFKDLFGDHVKVTIFANGMIELADYEHD